MSSDQDFNPLDPKLDRQVQDHTAELRAANAQLRQQLDQQKLILQDLKRSNQALKLRDEHLELALEGSGTGLWDWDILTHDVYFEPCFKAIMGYADHEMPNAFEAWESHLHPDDHDWVLEAVQRHLQHHDPYDVEYRLRIKTGDYCWVRARGQAIWDQAGQAVRMSGSIVDVTDRRQVEADLRAREALYGSLANDVLDKSEVGIFILDANFRVVWLNQALERYFGIQRDAVIGRDKRQLIHDRIQYIFEDPKAFADKVIATYDDNTYVEHFECHVLPEGDRQDRWLEHLSQPINSGLYAGGRIEHYSDITDRKQVEIDLRESEEKFRQLAENLREVFWITNMSLGDPSTQKVLYVSPAYEEIWGRKREDLYQEPMEWTHAIHPDDREAIATVFLEEVLAGGFDHVFRIVRPDQTIRWIRDRGFLVGKCSGGVCRIIGLAEDITERRQANEQLRQETQRSQLLAEITQKIRQSLQIEDILGTAVAEVQTLLHADRVLIFRLWPDGSGTVTQEAVVAGWPIILGQKILDPCFREEYIEHYRQGRIQATADIEQANFQLCYMEFLKQFGVKADLVVPILRQNELWGLLIVHHCQDPRQWEQAEIELMKQLANQMGIALSQAQLLENLEELVNIRTAELTAVNHRLQQEINERMQVEAALRQSEAQLRLTTDALPVLIAYVDEQQHYRFNNRAYEDWFGRPLAEIHGHHIRDVLGEFGYQQIQKYVIVALSGQKVSYETQVPHSDGQLRDVSVTYIPDTADNGEVKGFFALVSDISDRKAIERMKDEFISVVSHELRTPLTSIHGSLKLLATGKLGTLSAEGQQMLEIADENTDRLVRLVSDILDLQRIESGKMSMNVQDCDTAVLMVQAVDAMQGMAQSQEIILTTTPTSISFRADADYIVQTLTNLLSNAIKFSSAGDTVQLTAERVTREMIQHPSDQQPNGTKFQLSNSKPSGRPQDLFRTPDSDFILFRIRDQGQGIPADKLATIFERFHQIDASDSRRKGGTGLGLAICQKIVEQHDGKIWAESTLGEGSTFFVLLPTHPAL